MQTADDLIGRIRAAIAAVEAGLKSGRFDALRALATDTFATSSSDAELSQAFQPLLADRVDFAQLAQATPVTPGPPQIGPNGELRLNGLLQLTQSNVGFDIVYVWTGSRYALIAIALVPRAKAEPPVPFGAAPR